jgi:hypothetical protein
MSATAPRADFSLVGKAPPATPLVDQEPAFLWEAGFFMFASLGLVIKWLSDAPIHHAAGCHCTAVGYPTRLGVLLDLKITGLEPDQDMMIEIALVAYTGHR